VRSFCCLSLLCGENDFEGVCTPEVDDIRQRLMRDKSARLNQSGRRRESWNEFALLFEATTDSCALPLDGHRGISEAP
jgi:hypothetical protein